MCHQPHLILRSLLPVHLRDCLRRNQTPSQKPHQFPVPYPQTQDLRQPRSPQEPVQREFPAQQPVSHSSHRNPVQRKLPAQQPEPHPDPHLFPVSYQNTPDRRRQYPPQTPAQRMSPVRQPEPHPNPPETARKTFQNQRPRPHQDPRKAIQRPGHHSVHTPQPHCPPLIPDSPAIPIQR